MLTDIIDLSSLTDEQLTAALNQRKEINRKEKEKARNKYENHRNALVNELSKMFVKANNELTGYKISAFKAAHLFRDAEHKYTGKAPNPNQIIFNNEKTAKLTFSTQKIKSFDERVEQGVKYIFDFLESTVKKRDKNTFKLVMALLTPNEKTGKYYADSVLRVVAMKDTYNDENWQKGVELLEESYHEVSSKSYLTIHVREKLENDNYTAWELINLNFASIK